jgi:hypothetical protein
MIEELIKRVAGRLIHIINFEAEVISVDDAKDTCVVKPVDGPQLEGVKLKSILSDAESKFVIYPKLGSYVTCSILQNIPTECYVTQFSEIDKVTWNCEEIVINGGSNGGLVNWTAVKAELDKTNAVVSAMAEALKNFIPVGGDGGAALKTLATTNLTGKNVGNFDNKEDTKVKH